MVKLTKESSAVGERAQHLLKILIERYLREGTPVGSTTLATDSALALSSATIRNVLADLEDKGLLRSPHTSAGRIPTAQGLRMFVDSMLTVQALETQAVQKVKQKLNPNKSAQELAESASQALSSVTKLAGVVTLPKREQIYLRQLEFLPLSGNRVLVIIVMNEREVQNRIIYTDRHYSASELEQAGNYLNSLYAGKDLTQIRESLLQAMQDDKQTMNKLMQAAIDVANKAFHESEQSEEDYIIAGETNLLNFADDTGVEGLRSLFEAFTQKQLILHLLDKCLGAQGVQLFIGEESGYDILGDCSVITAPYQENGRIIGVLGVIGPTRLDYERVIPAVDLTAKLLSAALNAADDTETT